MVAPASVNVTINVSNNWEFMHKTSASGPSNNPLSYGWVTGQNKLNQNKHTVGTETLSLLAFPGSTVAASLLVNPVEEHTDEPSHSQTEA